MAKVCYFTGRKTVSGNNRSHAKLNVPLNLTFKKLLSLLMVNLKKFGLQLVRLNLVKLNAFNLIGY